VTKAQRALVRHGYLRQGTFTAGKLDSVSQRALGRFQREQTRHRDGRVSVGHGTSRALAAQSLKRRPRYLNLSGAAGSSRPGETANPADVKAVQQRLVHHGYLQAGKFKPGISDASTIEAVMRFQRDQTGAKAPDGRVDRGGRTSRRLARDKLRRPVSAAPVTLRHGSTTVTIEPGKRVTNQGLVAPDASGKVVSTRARGGPSVATHTVIPRTDRLISGKPAWKMTAAEAHAELRRLGIKTEPTGKKLGISDPVKVKLPMLGVHMPYVSRATKSGMPKRLAKRTHAVMDVRLAVAMAHTIQHMKARAKKTGWNLTHINQLGGYVTHRNNGALRTGGSHPRGLALDVHSFTMKHNDGRTTTVSVPGHWRTARSTAKLHANEKVVAQTASEKAGMSQNERWLRQVWGFMATEFHLVIGPSHNSRHWDHFHLHLRPTARQNKRNRASFAAYKARRARRAASD